MGSQISIATNEAPQAGVAAAQEDAQQSWYDLMFGDIAEEEKADSTGMTARAENGGFCASFHAYSMMFGGGDDASLKVSEDVESKLSISNSLLQTLPTLRASESVESNCLGDTKLDGSQGIANISADNEAITLSSARSTDSSTERQPVIFALDAYDIQPTIIALDSDDLDDANEAYFPMSGPVQDPPVMADLEASPKFASLHQETQGYYAQPLVEETQGDYARPLVEVPDHAPCSYHDNRKPAAKKLPIWFEKNWQRWALWIQCCSA